MLWFLVLHFIKPLCCLLGELAAVPAGTDCGRLPRQLSIKSRQIVRFPSRVCRVFYLALPTPAALLAIFCR